MTTFVKDPNAILDYRIDWATWLATDTIATSTWVDVTAGITVSSSTNTTTAATVWLTGGTAGNEYTLTNRITTTGGRTNDKTLTIIVRQQEERTDMAGFDDLIVAALPYLATEEIAATAGTTWQWEYNVKDDASAVVDMTTGYTATLSVRNSAYTEVIAATVTFPSPGVIRCKVLPTASAAVAAGTYWHELTVTRTSDSAKLVCVGAGDSTFLVKKKVS